MCEHTHYPFPRAACAVRVLSSLEIAPGVFSLVAGRSPVSSTATGGASSVPAPAAGQFFMLRARPSGVLLGRPISVYRSDDSSITFLILKKGRGTAELCALRAGDELDLVGPIGNIFPLPSNAAADANQPHRGEIRVALVGGGIGVAPVSGFSFLLAEGSFDFYASFRSAPYGLEGIDARAKKLVVTTEDGSAGVKGMLPAVFDAAAYDFVYACGPTPMLRYVKGAIAEAVAAGSPVHGFLSLEEHMACGAGACLGCTVRTINGNRRCCVDGPVFDASEVIL
jgi:dihydroorotate dehydrogenase (NAD+) catalytic subunit